MCRLVAKEENFSELAIMTEVALEFPGDIVWDDMGFDKVVTFGHRKQLQRLSGQNLRRSDRRPLDSDFFESLSVLFLLLSFLLFLGGPSGPPRASP